MGDTIPRDTGPDLTFISSLEGTKAYSQTGWGHSRIFPLDPPMAQQADVAE